MRFSRRCDDPSQSHRPRIRRKSSPLPVREGQESVAVRRYHQSTSKDSEAFLILDCYPFERVDGSDKLVLTLGTLTTSNPTPANAGPPLHLSTIIGRLHAMISSNTPSPDRKVGRYDPIGHNPRNDRAGGGQRSEDEQDLQNFIKVRSRTLNPMLSDILSPSCCVVGLRAARPSSPCTDLLPRGAKALCFKDSLERPW